MNKHKKANPINPVMRKLNAFMNGMENNVEYTKKLFMLPLSKQGHCT